MSSRPPTPPRAAARPFVVALDLASGALSPPASRFSRRLSDMAGAYGDQDEVARRLEAGDDPVIYEGYDVDIAHEPGELVFRTTVVAAGTVGSEFFMTKGHHHHRDSGELYVGMAGDGLMLMQTREGELETERLLPMAAVYVPPGWAHRTVNVGAAPLAFLAAYLGDAGHDYSSIERSGFAKRVHAGADGPELRDADDASSRR